MKLAERLSDSLPAKSKFDRWLVVAGYHRSDDNKENEATTKVILNFNFKN